MSRLRKMGIGRATQLHERRMKDLARSDIYIIDCNKQIGGLRVDDAEVLAKGIESMIDGGDGFITTGNIVLATVERVERHGNIVKVYVTPLDGIERGTTN